MKIAASTSADLDEFLKEVDQVEKMASKETVEKLNTSNLNNKETNFSKLPPSNLIPKPPISSLPNATINAAPFPMLLNPMGLINPHNPRLIKKPGQIPGAMIRPPIASNKHTLPNKNQQTVKREKEQTGPTIEAKPQLRNLSADLTKFLPTSLRIKRNQPEPAKRSFNNAFNQGRFLKYEYSSMIV